MMNAPDVPGTPTGMEPTKPQQTQWLLWAFLLLGVVVVGGMVIESLFGGYSEPAGERDEVDLARTKEVTKACQSYKTDNGAWPPTLETLTLRRPNGDPPYIGEGQLEPAAVPNGRYQYDAAGPHNNGEKPDIWVDGPRRQVGNWMARIEH